jgi:hypothetical protein
LLDKESTNMMETPAVANVKKTPKFSPFPKHLSKEQLAAGTEEPSTPAMETKLFTSEKKARRPVSTDNEDEEDAGIDRLIVSTVEFRIVLSIPNRLQSSLLQCNDENDHQGNNRNYNTTATPVKSTKKNGVDAGKEKDKVTSSYNTRHQSPPNYQKMANADPFSSSTSSSSFEEYLQSRKEIPFHPPFKVRKLEISDAVIVSCCLFLFPFSSPVPSCCYPCYSFLCLAYETGS